MNSSSADQKTVEMKNYIANQQCEDSTKNSSPRWIGQVQEYFTEKQADFPDVFEPLRKKFKVFDRVNNGIISKDEFLEALSTSGLDVKSATLGEIDSLFESFDIAGNGEISICEFVTVLGKPLIRNPNATVDDIFKEKARMLLMQGSSENALARQWEDICGRLGIDPRRGTLTFETFTEMMTRECDWSLSKEQLLPIFRHLDMNDNGKISIITMRFLVTEMLDSRTEGRTLMVIDLLKQAMTNCQGDVIRKQAAAIQRLNKELVEEHKTLKELEEISPHQHLCQSPIYFGNRINKLKTTESESPSVVDACFSWQLLAIISWATIFIIFLLTFFAPHPEGDFGVDLYGVIVPGIILSVFGVVYNISMWPIIRWHKTVGIMQVSISMFFGIATPVLFGLGVAFLNPFWYTDIDCFSCKRCSKLDETVCFGDWELIGGWQDTCPCALENEDWWDNAKFFVGSDYQDCNTTLSDSNYFEGKFERLKPCMFYSNGMFMKLGFAMMISTAIVTGASCWGCIKDIHLWEKYVSNEKYQEIQNQESKYQKSPSQKESELSKADFYG